MIQHNLFIYNNNRLDYKTGSIVQEFPVQLLVNGSEIATLIGSPHDLRFLVAGFLRLQGFVSSLDDFIMFSVCEEFGTANVRIKKELPEKLKPVLTSGCGTGITFTLPEVEQKRCIDVTRRFKPEHIFDLMAQLSHKADNYKNHGGIHSAAIGRNGTLSLYAEDLGRHNTFDRIAGEALFKGIDLVGSELVTSGRVSTEMVAKASLMGISIIASRTSPTDMAVKLCQDAGICLLGYVRADKFTIYSHAEMIELDSITPKIDCVTGVILAGGSSSRMGKNKALLQIEGVPLIELLYKKLSSLFHEVIIVTNTPELYGFIPCRKVPDIYPAYGSVAGIHSGLYHSSFETSFITACDMPWINTDVIRELYRFHGEHDATIPFSQGGQEPLHAFYKRSCLQIFTQAIENGERKILDIISKIDLQFLDWDTVKSIPGSESSFINVNTPQEYQYVNGGNSK